MYNRIKRLFILVLSVCIANGTFAISVNAGETVKHVVKNAREVYLDINKKIDKGTIKDCGIEDVYKEYMVKGKIRKTLVYPGNGDMDVKGYTVEYYYDKEERLVFAFAYKKEKGKMKEYRAYYSVNGKCYRTINSKGKTTDYKKGKDPSLNEDALYSILYYKGTWNIAIANEGDT